MKKHILVLAFVMFCSNITAVQVAAVESETFSILEISATQVRGIHGSLPIRFVSSEDEEGGITVNIVLPNKTVFAHFGADTVSTGGLEVLGISAESSEDRKISQEDHDLMMLLVQGLAPELSLDWAVERKLLLTVDMLVNFVPVGQALDEPIRREASDVFPASGPPDIRSLCDDRGSIQDFEFDIDRHGFVIILGSGVVGDPKPDTGWETVDGDGACKGRCGVGCSQPGQLFKRRYTQACFDHDFCASRNDGDVFGYCADEFFASADDYVFAELCPHRIIGTWLMRYEWDDLGVKNQSEWVFFGDHTYTNNLGGLGNWAVSGQSMLGQDAISGMDFGGTIFPLGFFMRGAMQTLEGRTGEWDANMTTNQTSP